MSNIYEAMRQVLDATASYGGANSARDMMRQMLDAYTALAPDWDSAPEWARWYAIDTGNAEDCDAYWFENEPHVSSVGWFGNGMDVAYNGIDLPDGIDWRLCKWQRPEVTK